MDTIIGILIRLLLSLGFISEDQVDRYYQTFRAMEVVRFERTEDGRIAVYGGGDGTVMIVFG